MSNINRRDYLKGMAATAGVVAGSKLEIFGQRTRQRVNRGGKRNSRQLRAVPLNWNVTPNRPSSSAFVTAIFSGLMGFAYEEQRAEGKVGFHGGHRNHQLIVKVYRYPSCELVPSEQPTVTNTSDITLQIEPQSTKPVDYFQTNPFNRWSGDPNDFRWLPDLDSADFYEEGLPVRPNQFRNWLHVKNATFYTYQVTDSTFNLVTPDGQIIHPFGHVAKLMAASIEPTGANEHVILKVDGQTIPLLRSGNVKYQILFHNKCVNTCVPARPSDIYSNIETKRNHFHHCRDVLDIPAGRLKIGLKIEQKLGPTDPTGLCDRLRSLITEEPDATDEAPCMGAGYGNDRL